jgi:hypothetical protein
MRRARPPAWWGRLTALLPQFDLPGIEPDTWTVELAERWVRSVPAKCPFERAVWWRGMLVLYIPALCSLNPVSGQLYRIRIAAQQYLLSANPDTINTDKGPVHP